MVSKKDVFSPLLTLVPNIWLLSRDTEPELEGLVYTLIKFKSFSILNIIDFQQTWSLRSFIFNRKDIYKTLYFARVLLFNNNTLSSNSLKVYKGRGSWRVEGLKKVFC